MKATPLLLIFFSQMFLQAVGQSTTADPACGCHPCKQITAGPHVGFYDLVEDAGLGRCGSECLYRKQSDGSMYCMCEPGDLNVEICSLAIQQEEWETWKLVCNKTYGPREQDGSFCEEEKFRLGIWNENKVMVDNHNNNRDVSFTLALNEFSDLQNHEFNQRFNGYQMRSDFNHTGPGGPPRSGLFLGAAHTTAALPENIDWRELGAVTPVKNQRKCLSCWSFSATGALEAAVFRANRTLVSLSEQQLMDCSWKYDNKGCDKGLMDHAFQYFKDNGGIDTEASYPYEAVDGICRYNTIFNAPHDVAYMDITAGNEDALKEAVATKGPVSVAIDASRPSFKTYKDGIYRDPRCSSDILDHGVLVVGYGVDNGVDYWLIKNSYGTTWGDKGYIKMARNAGNMCGVATAASYPLV